MPAIRYATVQLISDELDVDAVAQLMYWLMLRNVSSDGVAYIDPFNPHVTSLPGCIVASPSYPRDGVSVVYQNYVYNWTRDSAMAATEIALSGVASGDSIAGSRLRDYVSFAKTCQTNSTADFARATYTLDGHMWDQRDNQNDGPALQTLAILDALDLLPGATKTTALEICQANVDFLVSQYRVTSRNLWEEVRGQSFFTRAVQLRCLMTVRDKPGNLQLPAGLDDAITWLQERLSNDHWSAQDGYFISVLDPEKVLDGYDPNADIVMASVYGAVSCTDPKLLATAAKVRAQCATFHVNETDALSLGPLIGRYPGDTYDGDNNDPDHPHPDTKAHPWVLCSANLAELYYMVAGALEQDNQILSDELARPFFDQAEVPADADPEQAAARLRDTGDRILKALIRHSDHLALSEQFDADSGYEKSVHDLTWSYAAFLSAVRARTRLRLP
jgi:glucoamylase